MFKTAIKHYIYDYCIEIIFDRIQKNFPLEMNMFHKGQIFGFIEFDCEDIWWGLEDAEIIYIDKSIIIFSFASADIHIPIGDDRMEEYNRSSEWKLSGTYGNYDTGTKMFNNCFGGTAVFPVEIMKDIYTDE